MSPPLYILLVVSLMAARPSTSMTHLASYLRLDKPGGIWSETDQGDGMVIGVIDTGIWRESPSFNDKGLGPLKRWKGVCDRGNTNFTCNRKIVTARAPDCEDLQGHPLVSLAPTDYVMGHGTGVSAFAAGSPVKNVSCLGYGRGTAVGAAPKARLAMYDSYPDVNITCKLNSTWDMTMQAYDYAMDDGVDVISTSQAAVGEREPPSLRDQFTDSAFKAEGRGIPFVAVAGNEGLVALYSVRNTAPWMTTVGASTMDREFPSHLILGNGQVIMAQSVYVAPPGFDSAPRGRLVYVDVDGDDNTTLAHLVKGKIAVCSDCVFLNETTLHVFGAVGVICLRHPGTFVSFPIPVLSVGFPESIAVETYVNRTKNPVATIKIKSGKTVYGKNRAPMIAMLSSRGPGVISPEIIKPDIVAPGQSLITAQPRTLLVDFTAYPPYSIESGTSLACPIVAGIAAMVRKKHPNWSPAMIRSALMTTASITDNRGLPLVMSDLTPATPFEMGAGEVNPSKVLRPGLVYDACTQDYIDYMCTLNFPPQDITAYVGGPYKCNKFKTGVTELNYPSIGVVFNTNRRSLVVPRTVTKVSPRPETYKVKILNNFPEKFKVEVVPATLSFQAEGERASFKVNISALNMVETTSVPRTNSLDGKPFPLYSDKTFGHLIWESRDHEVKSPIGLLWEVLPHPSSSN